MDVHLMNYVVVAAMLILYGVAFIYVEYQNREKTPAIRRVGGIDYRTALLIGCFQ